VPEPDWSNTPNERGELPVGKDENGILRWANGRPDNRWDAWSHMYWGTKWAVVEERRLVSKSGQIICGFYSAWTPPIEAIIALSEKHPSGTLILRYYEDGLAFAGVLVAHGGRKKNVKIDPELSVSTSVAINDGGNLNIADHDAEQADEEWARRDWERRINAITTRLNKVEDSLTEDARNGRLESHQKPYSGLISEESGVARADLLRLMTSLLSGELRQLSDTPNARLIRK